MNQKNLQTVWDIALPDNASENQLLELLKKRIGELLIDDFNKLLNIMYRLDVSETKFKQAMSENGIPRMAEAIARLVVEREIQKMQNRTHHPQVNDGTQ